MSTLAFRLSRVNKRGPSRLVVVVQQCTPPFPSLPPLTFPSFACLIVTMRTSFSS